MSLLCPDNTQVRFLGDPSAKFTEALDLGFDGTAIFGGVRSKRYALVIEDGKVKEAYVEPDNTGVSGMFSSIFGIKKETLTLGSLCR